MKIFIINLPESTDRRLYMTKMLSSLNFTFDNTWVEAIKGNDLNAGEITQKFNMKKYDKNYFWSITPAALGCTLSHRKAIQEFINSNAKYSLILEDDIRFLEPLENFIEEIEKHLNRNNPTIFLLSGWFYFSSKKKLDDDHFVCRLVDARYAHAYLINREAALIINKELPWYLADDWVKIRRMGIEIYGISPHICDQHYKLGFKSSIRIGSPAKYSYSLKKWILNKRDGAIRRILKKFRNFEIGYF